jgi:hypothetical protein
MDEILETIKETLPGWGWGVRSHDPKVEGAGFCAWLRSPDFKAVTWHAGGQDTTDVVRGFHTFADDSSPEKALLQAWYKARDWAHANQR